jgi:peptide deformylase
MKTLVDELKIRYYGHPVLRKECLPIKNFTPLLSEVADKMFEIMQTNAGVGLAAPQVGLPWQMFVIDLGKPMVFINPQLTYSGPWLTENEGCLSLPGVRIDVGRPRDVYIHAQKLNGKGFKVKYAGWHSRCCQHEYDHLCGELIIDKALPLTWAEQILHLPSGVPTEEELQMMYDWEKHDVLGLPTDAAQMPQSCYQTG